jgi:hypothetical protein
MANLGIGLRDLCGREKKQHAANTSFQRTLRSAGSADLGPVGLMPGFIFAEED